MWIANIFGKKLEFIIAYTANGNFIFGSVFFGMSVNVKCHTNTMNINNSDK